MEYNIIDPVIIRSSMMNNEDMIKQLIDLYLVQSPIDFQLLTDNIERKDPQAIGSTAHYIKPTMVYIGANELKQNFQELETLGYQNASMEEILKKYEEIKPKFELMLAELKSFNI